VERVDKHPFQLSRVYYAARERPEETWAELADGSCRWRQSASEVAVIAMRVPPSLRPRHLAVSIGMRRIVVSNKLDGTIYLEGALERGIVPDDCAWAHGSGSGDDGCVLYLRKMNLELLAGEGAGHGESWWPRLFAHHPSIAWDDYEKDYSDLPAPVLAAHMALEAKDAVAKALEAPEKRSRDTAAERDDARRRARQERLHVLRGGTPLSWVELDRLNPAMDDMPEMPMTREGAVLETVKAEAAARQAQLLAAALEGS